MGAVYPLTRLGVGMVVTGALLSAVRPASAQATFGVPNGKVVYQMKGPMISGTQTMVWTDGGKKFRQDTKGTASLGQQSVNMNSWLIRDGDTLYVHSEQGGKQVTRIPVKPGAFGSGPTMPGMPPGGASKLGKPVGKATLLGRQCDIHQVNQVKIWIWKGIPLKSEVSMGDRGSMTVTATQVDTATTPAASSFKVPSGYQIVERPPMPQGGRPGAAPGKMPVR